MTALAERAIDLFETAQKPSESIEDYYMTFNEQKYAVDAKGAKCSSKAFLARLFIYMADNKRYKPLKD